MCSMFVLVLVVTDISSFSPIHSFSFSPLPFPSLRSFAFPNTRSLSFFPWSLPTLYVSFYLIPSGSLLRSAIHSFVISPPPNVNIPFTSLSFLADYRGDLILDLLVLLSSRIPNDSVKMSSPKRRIETDVSSVLPLGESRELGVS